MRTRMLVAAMSILALGRPSLAENQTREVVGSISNVIVYRGQALVTRRIEMDLPEGGSELIVQKLPNRIVPESLYAEAFEGLTVTSVRYRERAVKEDTREEVKKLEAQIEQIQTDIRHAEAQRRVIAQNMETLFKLQEFTVSAQSSDLNRGVLQFEPLEKLVSYIATMRGEYQSQILKLDDEIIELNKQLGLLRRKLAELQAGRSRTEREAVLVVNSPSRKKTVIEVNYLVNNASWLPQYNLRGRPEESKVTVEYNAIMHQASGEDWTDVALNLSTAQPTMAAGAPLLDPMKVKVAEVRGGRWGWLRRTKMADKALEEEYDEDLEVQTYIDLSSEFKQLRTARQEMARKGADAAAILNLNAQTSQMLELQADETAAEVMKKEAKRFARTEGVSVTYDLGKGLSMPSRSDQQLITIAAFDARADFLMIGTPLLTDYVYLQSDVVNGSDVILLAGPASMYRDGEFVGRGGLETVTMGEKFTAGFGVDSQIQISREFKDKKVDTLWGDRVERYDYRIAINNYKNSKVKLRLLERIPYSENEELEISGFETNIGLSKDAEYVRKEKDRGILRWDLNLAAGTAEEKATIVTYSYTMKYDNDMQIQPVPVQR
ncbi:MAG: mucoidy inhibitor MuiA family protein [Planctomycetota bacterium]